MNHQELQRILLMPEGLRAQYLAALKKPQKMADGGGFGRKAQRINQATSFGDEPMGNQIIKDVGGNWLGGNVEKALDPLTRTVLNDTGVDNLRLRQGDEVADSYLKERPRHEAANNWVRGNLTNYVKKQMATPDDPVRKLAEQGITHLPQGTPMPRNMSEVFARREAAGFPAAQGTSREAQVWEALADKPINSITAGEAINRGKGEPWMEKVDPFTTVYSADATNLGRNSAFQDLGFDHIMDVLKEDLAEGRIRPEQLSKISMEQAVRRVHEYDQDKLKKMKEAQIKNTEGMPVHKVYDDGHKWIELAMNTELPQGFTQEPSGAYVGTAGEKSLHHPNYVKLKEALKYEGDTMGHCVGGYCPDVAEGRSRIFSLRDAKGEPHVTIETQPGRGVGPKAFFMNDLAPKSLQNAIFEMEREGSFNDPHALEDFIEQSPEYKQYVKSLPPKIEQIKGKGNARPHTKYDKYTQDFVKAGTWDEVDDLHHTGLRKTSDAFNVNERKMIEQTGIKLPAHATPEEIKHINDTVWPQIAKKAGGGVIHMNKGGSGHAFVKHKHGEKVGGYHVGEKINNYGSYESSGISKVLPGIHKVPMSSFETTHPNDLFYAKNDHDKVRQLAEQIKHNKYLDPLLVAMDEKGPYVLEGGHRLGAAHLLGMKEIPAMVGYEPEVEHLAPKAQGGLAHMSKGGALPKHERDANLAQFLKDSAVKDRMYHATHSDFNAFRNNHRGIHFVTPKPKFANDFLTNSGQDEHEEGANIMPVHVNAKNPFDYQNKQHVNALGVKASIGKLGLDEIKKGKWGRIEDRTTLKAIKDLGHDGVYVNEGGVKNLGVFYPHQIKSAIGNRGTYDTNEADITKAKGGSIKPVGYTKEKVTVSPSLDRMQYELMSVKHFKKAK